MEISFVTKLCAALGTDREHEALYHAVSKFAKKSCEARKTQNGARCRLGGAQRSARCRRNAGSKMPSRPPERRDAIFVAGWGKKRYNVADKL